MFANIVGPNFVNAIRAHGEPQKETETTNKCKHKMKILLCVVIIYISYSSCVLKGF